MCGRFTNRLTWDEIVRLYRLTMKAPPHNLPPRYNICPTDPVDVVTERDGNRDFIRMRWGLVPSWWPRPLKDLKAATFNARSETLRTSHSFGMPSLPCWRLAWRFQAAPPDRLPLHPAKRHRPPPASVSANAISPRKRRK